MSEWSREPRDRDKLRQHLDKLAGEVFETRMRTIYQHWLTSQENVKGKNEKKDQHERLDKFALTYMGLVMPGDVPVHSNRSRTLFSVLTPLLELGHYHFVVNLEGKDFGSMFNINR